MFETDRISEIVTDSVKIRTEIERICPGNAMQTLNTRRISTENTHAQSCLSQWPVQIKLVSPNAPYFDGASLLIAADCTAYAYGNFHADFIAGKITLIDLSQNVNAFSTE